VIDELRKMGLSDLEARCYLALHEEANLSGYEVAKRVSVSRTNVYAALRSLTDKGLCRAMEADPIQYDAVPIKEVIRLLQAEFARSAKTLITELQTPPGPPASFYNWHGTQPIETAIHRIIANSEKHLIVDIWSEDVHWVEQAMLEAEERGVAVTLITIGKYENDHRFKHILVHKRDDEWQKLKSRKFSIYSDSCTALIGSFGSTIKLSALETNHPAVIELLQNAFYHDIVMEQIEHDYGSELDQKYGKNYQTIIDSYRERLL
jgi:sugar-specific transcriptional regulator TrmB